MRARSVGLPMLVTAVALIATAAGAQTEGAPAAAAQPKAKTFKNPIVTTLEPLTEFYEAEKYHQKYYANNSYQPYCQITIPPKLNKLHKQFAELLKSHGKSN